MDTTGGWSAPQFAASHYGFLQGAYPGIMVPQPRLPAGHTDYDINVGGSSSTPGYRTLVINSEDRNRDLYANANFYRVRLLEPYRKVLSLELSYAFLPNSRYVIDSHNNKFYFQDTAAQVAAEDQYEITLDVGNYSIYDVDNPSNPSVCKNLEDAMNAASSGSTYTVTWDQYTRKVTITQTAGSGLLNLLNSGGSEPYGTQFSTDGPGGTTISGGETHTVYPESSLCIALGFAPALLTGATTYTGTLQTQLDVDNLLAIRMRCNGKRVGRIDSTSDRLGGSLTTIALDRTSDQFSYVGDGPQAAYRAYFNPPLETLRDLEIEIVDKDGLRYNFNGLDHTLSFIVCSLAETGELDPTIGSEARVPPPSVSIMSGAAMGAAMGAASGGGRLARARSRKV